MLWMKAWLETRWRLLFALALPLSVVLLVPPPPNLRGLAVIVFFFMFAAIYLAGSGITTQAAFRATRGLHGSTLFTLSLPVSRLRLLVIRWGVGMAATAAVIVIVSCIVWLRFPIARENSTPVDLFKLVVAGIICTACFYCFSALLSTFLDDAWQILGSAIAIWVTRWIIFKLSLPPSANIFGFLGNASPLVTHAFPWPAMAISVIVSAVLFWAALKVVQNREY